MNILAVNVLDIAGMVAFLVLTCNLPLILYFLGRVRERYWFFNCYEVETLAEYQLQASKVMIAAGALSTALLLLFAYIVHIQTEPRMVLDRLNVKVIQVRLIPWEKELALIIAAFACIHPRSYVEVQSEVMIGIVHPIGKYSQGTYETLLSQKDTWRSPVR